MPEKSRTASGCRPSLPEVAVTLQKDNSIPEKINLSVAEEIALLRERNRQLEDENAILREREITLARDSIETLNTVTDALRAIQPGKEAARFLRDSEERIQNATPEDRPFIINARIKTAAAMIRDSPPATCTVVVEGPDPLRYDTRNLNQKRAEAIAAHVQQTGKASIKSTEARAVLETVEGRGLDRKSVWRALRAAQGILRATVDKVGGVGRLVLSSPSRPLGWIPPDGLDGGHELGGGGGVPRPRRDRVPWDG